MICGLIVRRFQWVLDKCKDDVEGSNVPDGSHGILS